MKRKRIYMILSGLLLTTLLFGTTACSNTKGKETIETKSALVSTQTESTSVAETKEETQPETEAETTVDNSDKVENKASVSLALPPKYTSPCTEDKGTVEAISYFAKDYIGDGEDYEKKAFVYLPAGYDETKQYNVLYLMHGIGGSENEWGLNDKNSRLKNILDNLVADESIEPFIVVTPNGKALACKHESPTAAFYSFGYELRNDLIPYIESHYATYAQYDENGYDLTATRTHRAMAGLSMGGMQTINIGIGECLDLFSWFGAFSAAPTSNPAQTTAKTIDESEYTVDYFYNICGTEDDIAFASAVSAGKNITSYTERLVENENYMWQERSGGHDFTIWHLGMYNFSQLIFKN